MSNTPKRILIFSLSYYPKHIGGAEVAIKEITDRISPNEVEFHMVSNRYDKTLPGEEQVGNVFVHRIGIATNEPTMGELRQFPLHLNKVLYQYLAYRKAKQLHKKYNYDGLWAVMAHGVGIAAGFFKGKHPDVPYILTLQEGDPLPYIERKMRFVWPFFRRAFARADVLQSISTYLDEWGKRMGFKGDAYVIPNAVNTKHFAKDIPEDVLRRTKKELGKEEGDVFLVTTSRLVSKNAIDEVIRALTHLPEQVHFAVLGEGPHERTLRKLVAQLGLKDRVHFMGHVTHEEMPRYLKACDVFVRPSRSEGFGVSFVEAMAAGIPVVTTQVGGITDFLFDKDRNPGKQPTGFAVDVDAPDQIAHQVEYILEHKEEVGKTTENAKNMVMERYDWDLIARDMKEKVFSHIKG